MAALPHIGAIWSGRVAPASHLPLLAMSLPPTNRKIAVNRSTFILGFAMVVIAATLAASITLRDTPGSSPKSARSTPAAPRRAHASPAPSLRDAAHPGWCRQATRKADALGVALPDSWLASLPGDQQVEWRARAATVEKDARARLERLTTDLALSAAQRDAMFPVLVRATPGYDPVMLVGGTRLAAESSVAAAEAIHQVLDPQQQALVEDQEINRQLWWQDTLARLEAGLLASTDGPPAAVTATPPAPADAAPPAAERVAPAARENGNLFDTLESNQ